MRPSPTTRVTPGGGRRNRLAHSGSGQTPGAPGRRASGGLVNPRRDSVPGPARAGTGGHDPQGSASGRGPGLPVSSAPQAWRLVWSSSQRARHASTGRRIGARCPLPLRRWRRRSRPQGRRQEDLEGERSPGRTVLASPVTNPVREARTRRWSKALKRPTLPVEPGSASTRKGGGGSAAVPGARSMPGELAVTSVVEEAPGDVWRSAEQSVGQSPSNRRGRPASPEVGGTVRRQRPR